MSLGGVVSLGVLLDAPPLSIILEQSYSGYNKHMNYF